MKQGYLELHEDIREGSGESPSIPEGSHGGKIVADDSEIDMFENRVYDFISPPIYDRYHFFTNL